MARWHLFEWEDQPWFPALIRDAGTGYLRFVAERAGVAAHLAPVFRELLARADERRIVDLCSGGGGPLFAILAALEDDAAPGEDEPLRATLTDLHPNVEQLEALAEGWPGRVRVWHGGVDARAVPDALPGLRTLFSAFHHFRPEDARGILSSAARARQPIAVVELVARRPLSLLGILLAPVLTLLVVPFLRPFRWGWLPLTYLVPVIPLFVLWDGLVSCLRCYDRGELEALAAGAGGQHYRWEVREVPMGASPVPATLLLGWPVSEAAGKVGAADAAPDASGAREAAGG